MNAVGVTCEIKKMLNKGEPRVEPCGTPNRTEEREDLPKIRTKEGLFNM
jgi:hypothetical protein